MSAQMDATVGQRHTDRIRWATVLGACCVACVERAYTSRSCPPAINLVPGTIRCAYVDPFRLTDNYIYFKSARLERASKPYEHSHAHTRACTPQMRKIANRAAHTRTHTPTDRPTDIKRKAIPERAHQRAAPSAFYVTRVRAGTMELSSLCDNCVLYRCVVRILIKKVLRKTRFFYNRCRADGQREWPGRLRSCLHYTHDIAV